MPFIVHRPGSQLGSMGACLDGIQYSLVDVAPTVAAMLRVPGSWRPLALRPSDLGHARPPEAARGSSTTTPTTTTDPRITEWLARLAASGGGNSSDGGAAQPLLPIQWMHTPKTG